jgi:hypothetical protein
VGDSLGLNKESTSRDLWFSPVSLRSELYGAKVQVSLLDLDLYNELVTVVQVFVLGTTGNARFELSTY